VADLSTEALFKPPSDDALAVPAGQLSATQDGFYVVAPRKMALLYVSTVGVYSLVWFYKNWARVKESEGSSISPLGRTIFALFFTHQLFRRMRSAARSNGVMSHWDAEGSATAFVALSIGSTIASRFDPVVLTVLSLLFTMGAIVPMLGAQRVANAASGDAQGSSNAELSAGNYVAIVVGLLFWALALAGLILG
jgi:hypothetical protein